MREILALTPQRRLARVADAQLMLEGLTEQLAPEVDQEAGRIALDAAPRPAALVDKSGLPANWRDCVNIVSGLPRSSTGLAMRMLAAGIFRSWITGGNSYNAFAAGEGTPVPATFTLALLATGAAGIATLRRRWRVGN